MQPSTTASMTVLLHAWQRLEDNGHVLTMRQFLTLMTVAAVEHKQATFRDVCILTKTAQSNLSHIMRALIDDGLCFFTSKPNGQSRPFKLPRLTARACVLIHGEAAS